MHKIFKLCGSPPEEYWEKSKLPHSTAFKPQRPYRRRVAERFQDISAPALALIETLLSIDPASRGTATSALDSEVRNIWNLYIDGNLNPDNLWKLGSGNEVKGWSVCNHAWNWNWPGIDLGLVFSILLSFPSLPMCSIFPFADQESQYIEVLWIAM